VGTETTEELGGLRDTASEKAKGHATSGAGLSKEERIYIASQWQLMWWRFRQHKMAMIAMVITSLFYFVALFCEVLAPYDPHTTHGKYKYAPPQRVHFLDQGGRFHLRPFVYRLTSQRDPETLRIRYFEDKTKEYPIYLLVQGSPYKLWGLFKGNVHLIGLGVESEEATMFLLGTDRMGRDMLSRIMYGARISMTVGLVGTFLCLILGVTLGGISGYYGGAVDLFIQRLMEFLRSIPHVPLWMGLAAAMPPSWPPVRVYFAIIVILSFIGWTGLARAVRGWFLSLRDQDFVVAARLAGASELRIIFRHMLPSFLSYIIAYVSLDIPDMILSETSLSFLGLGLRPPVVSWGVLLQEAQNVRTIATSPWLLLPAAAVIIAVLSLNFVGDGLRDAADPYAR